jgi:hypothetical protein
VLLSELWHLESRWEKDAQKIQERYLSIIREIIEEGKQGGYFKRDLDTKAATTAFFGLVSIASLDWAAFHPDVPCQTMYDTIRTIFLDGALA